MPDIVIDQRVKFNIVGYVGILPPESEFISLRAMLQRLHAVLPLHKLVMERTVIGPPATYLYLFDPVDPLRPKWRQTIILDTASDPQMDFDQVHGLWRQSEFAEHRALRSWFIWAANQMAFEKWTCTFP